MNFEEYLQAIECEETLSRSVNTALASMSPLSVGEEFSAHRMALATVSKDALLTHVVARHRWLAWCTSAAETASALKEQGIENPTEGLVNECLFGDEVAMMGRSLQAGLAENSAAAVQLWRAVITAAQAHSTLEVLLAAPNHPRKSAYEPLLTTSPVAVTSIEDMNWIQLRGGVSEGALNVVWTHTTDGYESELTALEAVLDGGSADSFVKKHVVPYVNTALLERMSLFAEENLARAAGLQFAGFLQKVPVTASPVAGAFVGSERQRLGLAVIDRKGNLLAKAPLRPTGDWTDRIVRWLRDNRARVVVLPTRASATHWLDDLVQAVEADGLEVERVDPAGMVTARGADDPVLRRASPEEASAIVLARRSMRPLEEWGRMDPIRLGLVGNVRDQNTERLREAFELLREQSMGTGQPVMAVPLGTDLRARSGSILNPGVNNMDDLRPGMSLSGVVSNVTKFGAFVNVGIKNEGLVHISELSDDFVGEPGDVVKSGQQVTVRVLSIDRDRNRIALSMRTEGGAAKRPAGRGVPLDDGFSRRSMGSKSRSPAGSGGDSPREANPETRAQALASLENLFKD